MPMHMLWRWDAGVKWIDIRHKVTGGSRFVNGLRHDRQSIPSMSTDPARAALEAYFNSGRRSVTESCCG